jgi:hypothetical protein
LATPSFNEYGKCSFIDGTLQARDLLVNAFGDSALLVTRSLKTHFLQCPSGCVPRSSRSRQTGAEAVNA